MLRLIMQKLRNKNWLSCCLFLGLSLLAGVFSCHPMFVYGSGNVLIQNELLAYAKEQNEFPAVLSRTGICSTDKYPDSESVLKQNRKYEEKWMEYIDLDPVCSRQYLGLDGGLAAGSLMDTKKFFYIGMLSDMQEHITVVKGQGLTEAETKEGLPCIVSESVMDDYGLVVGEELTFPYSVDAAGNPATFVIAGIFRENPNTDNYWYHDRDFYKKHIFVSRDTFDKLVSDYGFSSIRFEENLLLDYTGIDAAHAQEYEKHIEGFEQADSAFSANFKDTLETYERKFQSMRRMLWALELPCVLLLLLFVYMVSEQILNSEEGEIAVLRSRGATKRQVLRLYIIQSGILAAAGCLMGILLGFCMCRGAARTDAFLTFSAKDVSLYPFTWRMIPYAATASVLGILFMTLPVWRRTGLTIVQQKSGRGKEKGKPVWERAFADVILLLISVYLRYDYSRQSEAFAMKMIAGENPEPMFFLEAPLFIFSCSLLFLRLVKYLLLFLRRIGTKKWGPAPYAVFLQIGRTVGKRSILSIFLIMTIGCGIFDANMARTVNENSRQRTAYDMGADLRMQARWTRHRVGEAVWYDEPDFLVYEELIEGGICDGVTRVLVDDEAELSAKSRTLQNVTMMGIHTREFGETAELMEGLNDVHWFYALNALAGEPDGVIISRNVAEQCNVSVGDTISYFRCRDTSYSREASTETMEATVAAVVDSFPGYERYEYERDENGEMVEQENYLLVGNYATIVSRYGIMPYEIWMRLAEGGTPEAVRDFLTERNIELTRWSVLPEEQNARSSEALFQITNGMFTMDFLITLMICSAGFLIYWTMEIRGRELMFGVCRAMGMHMEEVRMMLVLEQLLGSVLPMGAGVGAGALATLLFVRVMTRIYLPQKHNIPIKILLYYPDWVKLSGVLLVVFVVCCHLLKRLVANMKISRALKLGED